MDRKDEIFQRNKASLDEATEVVIKQVLTIGAQGAAKKIAQTAVEKGVARALSYLPGVGLCVRVPFICHKLQNRNFSGALADVLAGTASCIPVVGTTVSLAIDVATVIIPVVDTTASLAIDVATAIIPVVSAQIWNTLQHQSQPTSSQHSKSQSSNPQTDSKEEESDEEDTELVARNKYFQNLLIKCNCAATHKEEVDSQEKVNVGASYIAEVYSSSLMKKSKNNQELDSDSDSDSNFKYNWLYIVATTTEELRERGLESPYKNGLNVIADYIEEKKENLVYKVGYSRRGNLLNRIQQHNKTYGSKFICAFHIPYLIIEQLIHAIFYLSRRQLIQRVKQLTPPEKRPDGYTELYRDSTLFWVVILIHLLMLIPRTPFTPRIMVIPEKEDLDDEFKSASSELFFESDDDYLRFERCSFVRKMLSVYLYTKKN